MSGLGFIFTTSEVALAPATLKTGLQIITPSSHHRIRIEEFGIYFDASSVEAGPGQVLLCRQTTIGTMTGFAAVKTNESDRETVQTSGGWNATAEPTITDVIKRIEVHPQNGYEYVYPMGREFYLPGGAKIGVAALFPNSVNAVFYLKGDE